MGDWQFTTNNQTGEIICTNCGKVQEKVALDSGIDFNDKGAVGKFIHSGIGK
jgi:transcription initiation factor TFIIIB Brf1 subunit/transcription initiation factor TFIIB